MVQLLKLSKYHRFTLLRQYLLRPDGGLCDLSDGERRGVEGEDGVLGEMRFHLLDDAVLQSDVLEHGLDHHVFVLHGKRGKCNPRYLLPLPGDLTSVS